jgi:DNA polymerase III subunit epsilon
MTILVIDTETTGLTHLSFPTKANLGKWPRIVQLAWILADDRGPIMKGGALIRPEGFSIPKKATKIHGITQLRALTEGENLLRQLQALNQAMHNADILVAHNLSFDREIIQSEALRIGFKLHWPRKHHCTAHLGQKYLQKTQKRKLYTYPKLSHLYQEIFGTPPKKLHDAQADALACLQIYQHLQQLSHSENATLA